MQQVRTTSDSFEVTVAPAAGNQTDMVTAVRASCPDFIVDAQRLPAPVYRVCDVVSSTNQISPADSVLCRTKEFRNYAFNTSFRPTVPGTVSCVVTVTMNDATDRTITLTGTGVAPAIAVDVQPGAIAFGEVRNATDSTLAQVAVRSTGGQSLAVSSVTTSSGFMIRSGPTTAYELAPNLTRTYAVACHPVAVGAMTGQLVVMSNDPAQPMVALALSCKGIDSTLDIEPSPATFPTTRVGEPVDATINLSNTGAASMTLEGVAIVGTRITMAAGPPLPMKLATPGAATPVDAHFDAAIKGDTSATLIVTYDGGKKRTTQITARALATSLALTPDGDINFGPVCTGQRKVQDFTLIANDQGGFSLRSISDPGAPFTVAAPALPFTVVGAGGNQLRFQITAAPTAEGVATAEAVVHTDIPRAADHTLRLSVQGLPTGVTATPDTIYLGSSPINETTIGQEVHLSNCGTSPIMFRNARIEGGNALDFAVVAQPSSSMIAPGGIASWLIVLQAHSVGLKRATFAVDYDGGMASIEVNGEGLPADPARGSYYACSTGRPIGLWPLVAALVVVLRRRARR